MVMMPRKDGVDACREIMELLPDTRVMMLTASSEEDAVIEAIAAGATGYLQKYSRPEELVGAVVDVAEGRLRIPEEAVRQVFAMIRGERGLASRQNRHKLSALERETLVLFASGRSYVEIAQDRGNSVVTVRNTLYRLQNKLGIGTKQELVGLGREERPAGRGRSGPKADSRIVFSLPGIDGMEAVRPGALASWMLGGAGNASPGTVRAG